MLLLTVGRSEASGRAAASHTGALVSTRTTVEAVCRDAGALLSLRHAPLLTGWRGAPPVHLDAAAALCALARAGAEHPELAELEVNPLLVHPGGAIALDAHGVLR